MQYPNPDSGLTYLVTLVLSRTVSEMQRLIGWKMQIFPTPLIQPPRSEWPLSNL